LFKQTYNNVVSFSSSLKQSAVSNVCISLDLVDEAILKLKVGKAAGHDGLVCEHIINADPVLIVIINKLFKLMLLYEFVQDDFGIGIMVPILQASVNNKSDSTDGYRGISINPIIYPSYLKCVY